MLALTGFDEANELLFGEVAVVLLSHRGEEKCVRKRLSLRGVRDVLGGRALGWTE